MSTFNRMLVFPEGHSAQEVLAVDLDNEATEYLSTYPGTARWLRDSEAVDLADDLAKLGKHPEDYPKVIPGLPENVLPSESTALAFRTMLRILVGGLVLIAVVIFGPESLNPFVHLIIGLGAGIGAAWLVNIPYLKKIRFSSAHDEELKRIYDERLQEASDHIVIIDDPDADDVREALAHVDATHDNLKLLRRYGLSTLEESEAVDEHLATLLRAHIAERSAKSRLERFSAVLRGVDTETITADADLQSIQQRRDELSHTVETARQKASTATDELNQLEKATTTALRQTEAKIQAAELKGQEVTEL